MKYLYTIVISILFAATIVFSAEYLRTSNIILTWLLLSSTISILLTHLLLSQTSKVILSYWQLVYFGWLSTVFGFAFFFFFMIFKHGIPPERVWFDLSIAALLTAAATFILSLLISIAARKGRFASHKKKDLDVIDDLEL